MPLKKDPNRVKAKNKPRSIQRGKQILSLLPPKILSLELFDSDGNPRTAEYIEQRRLSHNASYNLRHSAAVVTRALLKEHEVLFRRDNIVIPIVSDNVMIDYLRNKVNLIVTPTLSNQPGLLSAM